MQRRFERDEMFRILFNTDNYDKKINYMINKSTDGIYIVNGKSGIIDKPCSRAQADRSIRIIRAALTDNSAKFVIEKKDFNKKPYNIKWDINQDKVLNNAISYLNCKGIPIKCPYENAYDIRLIKKFISQIFCDYIIPALYYPNNSDEVKDSDDISVRFEEMVNNVNELLLKKPLEDIIYDLAEPKDFLRIREPFIGYPIEQIITTNNGHHFVLSFNADYRTSLKIIKDRNKEESGVIFEPVIDIDYNLFGFMFPKRFIYVSHHEPTSAKSDPNMHSLIIMNASRCFRNELREDIGKYYSLIIEHIVKYSKEILSIDYVALCDDRTATLEELESALHDFKINFRELWNYLKESKVSPRGSIEFIIELINRSVSIFCQKIYMLCQDMVITSVSASDNTPDIINVSDSCSGINVILPEGEFFDEYVDKIANNSSNDTNDDIWIDASFLKIEDSKSEIKYLDNDNCDNTGNSICSSEKREFTSLFELIPDRASEIYNNILILAKNKTGVKANKLNNELRKFLTPSQKNQYCQEINDLLSSDKLKNNMSNERVRKISPLIIKMLLNVPDMNTSTMYREELTGKEIDDYLFAPIDCSGFHYRDFKYNMYKDLYSALSKLYGHLKKAEREIVFQ